MLLALAAGILLFDRKRAREMEPDLRERGEPRRERQEGDGSAAGEPSVAPVRCGTRLGHHSAGTGESTSVGRYVARDVM